MSFLSALLILFVALKLLGFIDWSWWLVTLPFTASVLLYALMVLFVSVYAYIKER